MKGIVRGVGTTLLVMLLVAPCLSEGRNPFEPPSDLGSWTGDPSLVSLEEAKLVGILSLPEARKALIEDAEGVVHLLGNGSALREGTLLEVLEDSLRWERQDRDSTGRVIAQHEVVLRLHPGAGQPLGEGVRQVLSGLEGTPGRDPFVEPAPPEEPPLQPGAVDLRISELRIAGILKLPDGPALVVEGPTGDAHLLRPGTRLRDGELHQLEEDRACFDQEIRDATGRVKEVVKVERRLAD